MKSRGFVPLLNQPYPSKTIMSSFYNESELKKLGLGSFGKNVLISRKASIYGGKDIHLGNNVRIDDFCILSGKINIGNYVHISAYTALYGKSGLQIGDFSTISTRSIIFTAIDDFSGEHLISPLVPDELVELKEGKVTLNDFVQLGANTVVMPGVELGEGAATGTFSLVLKSLDSWTINFGIPCKYYKPRSQRMKKLAENLTGFK